MANLVPKVNNSGTIGTTAKKWANIHATTITPSAQASDLSLNSQKITNLAAPVASTDAATKAYVDSDAVKLAGFTPSTVAGGSTNGAGARHETITLPNGLVMKVGAIAPSDGTVTETQVELQFEDGSGGGVTR